MARINTNVPSLIAQFNLGRSNADLDLRLQRLATGLRINRGADDPAGLIISERIGADLAGTEQAIRNGERAQAVIATTESGLAEVNELLLSIKQLLVESANTGANSVEERDANQLQIDSAIQSITRISNTASFGGLRLLDGTLSYTTSGIASSSISKANILGASFVQATQVQVEIDVVTSAQRAALFLDGNDGGRIVGGVVQSTFTLAITGSRGVQEITFPSNTSLSDVRDSINSLQSLTGVQADLINGSSAQGLVLRSDGYGTGSFVSVEQTNTTSGTNPLQFLRFADGLAVPDTSGTFDFAGFTSSNSLVTASRDVGQDVQALINGNLAVGRGLEVSINSPALAIDLVLTESFAGTPSLGTSNFDITGGGAVFQLGPEITALQQFNFGVQSTAATNLGGVLKDGGLQFLSSLQDGRINSIAQNVSRGNDFTTASDIVDQAIEEITLLRGRLGAVERNVLEANRRSLQSSFENLTASRSVITDADFAAETAELTRAQILQSSGTTVLSLANQRAQSVLQLLG